MKLFVLSLILVFVEAMTGEKTPDKDGCSVTPNGGAIDWDRLSQSGKWFQLLNTKNSETTTGSCTLIRVKKQKPGHSAVSFNLKEVGVSGHKITVYNSWLSETTKKSSPILKAILSTLKIDQRSDVNMQLDVHSFDIAPEHFVTDYESYFIGKMCWNDQMYIWAYTKERQPLTDDIVSLFGKITSMPDSTPVTFSECEEPQDFAMD